MAFAKARSHGQAYGDCDSCTCCFCCVGSDSTVFYTASARNISDHRLIGLSAGIPLQTHIDAHLRRDGITPNYRVRLPSKNAAYAVVSTGAGSAILPLGTARRLGVRTKNVLPIEEPWAQRDAWMLVKEGRTLADVEKSFIDALLSFRDEES